MIHERHKRAVFVAHRFPVDAVHVRRVEEIALLSPAFIKDLFPFRLAIELQYEDPVIAVVPDVSTEVTSEVSSYKPQADEGAAGGSISAESVIAVDASCIQTSLHTPATALYFLK